MSMFWKINFFSVVLLKWITSYVLNSLAKRSKPVHILFCIVDHFEPGTGSVSTHREIERVTKLLAEYPKLAHSHKDSAGNLPKRTWFFPPHYHRNNNLKRLVSLCKTGYGEIELHLHHGKTRADTPENLRRTIEQCIEEYGYFGIFGTENGRKRYGFIHGDWALNNSRRGRFCGVNNEIQILKETGCYADFTFPCLNEANPVKINSIYYALGNPKKPKSYNKGIPVKRSLGARGDLMLIQGPLHPYFINQSLTGLRVLGDSIHARAVSKERIDLWIRTGIHVKGLRNWILIKTHMHGGDDDNAASGNEMGGIFTYLEEKYNDGNNYVLHYVTARELYNIIKSAEAGEPADNPEQFRNYKVQPPLYDSSVDILEASDKLKNLIAKTYQQD
jgi:hypothetical protein